MVESHHHVSLSHHIKKIREQAKKSMERGPVTADYHLNLEKAYQYLNAALATEIMCVLRYRHHQIVAKGIDRPQVAAEFKEHADEEEAHMMLIANRINQLGGDPDFNPDSVTRRTATEYGTGDSLFKMIEEDLVAERVAIMTYRELIDWFGSKDPTTRGIFEFILKEEEEHADEMAQLLKYKK